MRRYFLLVVVGAAILFTASFFRASNRGLASRITTDQPVVESFAPILEEPAQFLLNSVRTPAGEGDLIDRFGDAVDQASRGLAAGTLKIRDRAGRHYVDTQTEISFALADTVETVDVINGKWESTLPVGTEVTITGIRCGVLEVSPQTSSVRLSPNTEVVGDVPLEGNIHVVDAATGVDLDGIDIYVMTQWQEGVHAIPVCPPMDRSCQRLLTNATSPIAVPSVAGINTMWVSSPAYQWHELTFSGAGGPRIVKLRPGASVTIAIDPHVRLTNSLMLRLDHAETGLVHYGQVSAHTFTLDGLPPGAITGVLMRRSSKRQTIIDGPVSAELTLNAAAMLYFEENLAERGSAHTIARFAEPIESLPFADSLARYRYIGPLPHVNDLNVRIIDLTSAYDAAQSCSAQLELAPGLWEVSTWPFHDSRLLSISPASQLTIDHVIPMRRLEEVWTVAAEDGAAVNVDGVSWRVDGAHGAWIACRRGNSAGSWIVECPRVPVRVKVHSTLYQSPDVVLAPRADGGAQVIELSPREVCYVEFSLYCDEAEVPLPMDEWEKVKVVGPGRLEGFATKRFGRGPVSGRCTATMVLTAPGLYVVEFPEVEGYRPPEAFSVMASHGEPFAMRVKYEATQ